MTTTKDAGTVIVDHVIGDRGRLAIHLTSAEIRLAATDGDRVVVRTPAEKHATDRVIVETTDDGLAIRDKESTGLSFGRGRRVVQLEIEVPALAEIAINTTSGWLDAIGLRGEQRYKTTSGEFRLRDGAGQIELNTVSGDAQIELVAPTELSIKSVSGDVTVGGGRLDALRIGTTSGDVRVDSPLARSTDNRIETLSGDVQLVTTAGLRVEARTVSGDLTTNLPHRSEGRMGRRTLIIGDGSIELAFRSVSGDLRIDDGSGRSGSPVPPIPPIAPRPPTPPVAPVAPFGTGIALPDIDFPDLDLPGFGPGGWSSTSAPTAAAATTRATATTPATADPRETERMAILRALEQGELDVATAMDRLAALDDETDEATQAATDDRTDDRGHLLLSDALDQVLRLVADGRLTAAQAAPILDALAIADLDGPVDDDSEDAVADDTSGQQATSSQGTAKAFRIEITEGGRRVLNLRVPVSLGRMALDRIPGLSGANVDLVRQALSDGRSGTLLHIDEEDGSVRIALE